MEKIIELPVEKLKPNPWNVNFLTEDARSRLRSEMAKYGLRAVEPLTVREKDGCFEIVDGKQRWRIAKELGWKTIPVVIKEFTDEEVRELCLSYNVLRGHADWFKLAEIMAEEAMRGVNLSAIYEGVLTPQEIRIILSLNNLDGKAKRILRKMHREKRLFSLEFLDAVTRFPREFQPEVARMIAEKNLGLGGVKHLLLIYGASAKKEKKPERTAKAEKPSKPEKPAKPEIEAEEGRVEEEKAGGEELKEEKPMPEEEEEYREEEAEAEPVEVLGAAEEKAICFICKCGIRYKIDFEKKTIEKVRERERSEVFQFEYALPAVLEVECPRCHARGKVDVRDAKVEWSLT